MVGKLGVGWELPAKDIKTHEEACVQGSKSHWISSGRVSDGESS